MPKMWRLFIHSTYGAARPRQLSACLFLVGRQFESVRVIAPAVALTPGSMDTLLYPWENLPAGRLSYRYSRRRHLLNATANCEFEFTPPEFQSRRRQAPALTNVHSAQVYY